MDYARRECQLLDSLLMRCVPDAHERLQQSFAKYTFNELDSADVALCNARVSRRLTCAELMRVIAEPSTAPSVALEPAPPTAPNTTPAVQPQLATKKSLSSPTKDLKSCPTKMLSSDDCDDIAALLEFLDEQPSSVSEVEVREAAEAANKTRFPPLDADATTVEGDRNGRAGNSVQA